MRRGFGRCAMVAPGPTMGGDVVSTLKIVLDGNPMDHGEVPNNFPRTWEKGTRRAGWLARGSELGVRRTGWVASGSELGGTRIADRSWRPTRKTGWVARGSELGPQTWHADWRLERLGVTRRGSELGACTMGAGPDGWNLGIAGARHRK